ncbi:MAG: hypothetical protein RLY69_92 [Verrucomicrobiota bacterium]|jgi:hypothetical protein
MGWLDNPYRHTATEAEDFACPPSGGRGKLITLGIVIPFGLMIYAANIWLTKEAYWPGRRSSGMTVTGDTALAMSVGYAFLSLFCHFRWFWGLVPHYLTFRIGTTISLIGFLGALGASFFFLFQ